MPRLEDYLVHCRAESQGLFPTAICRKVAGALDLIIEPAEFLRRAGGVCQVCASSHEWAGVEYRLLHPERKP